VSEPAVPATKNPWKSPTYPQRVHAMERPQWLALLSDCRQKVEQAGRELGTQANPARQRLHAQMKGALDQIADAVGRLPGEVGDLYEEDKHRLDEAKAALDRLVALWASA
jgi:hypothetical protein